MIIIPVALRKKALKNGLEKVPRKSLLIKTGFHDLKNVLQGSVEQGDYGDDVVELEAEAEDFPKCVFIVNLFQNVNLFQ